ncbi:penicillin-insensitive murein endopeptidase precursor [bacterium BMS3Bbin10]|nr:penicillin-insensitive murein endopeptidase precursor [bacterium BMS3Bbin10]
MHRRTSSPARWAGAAFGLIAAGGLLAAAVPAAAEPAAKKLFGTQKTSAALSARSIGSYARGCLAGGQSLPVSGPAWEAMKLQRNRNWGHPLLIKFLQRFATDLQEKDGWPGLLIGDMAQPRGGPMLGGHKSHQSGLDADIWYKPKPARAMTRKERADSWSIKLAEVYGKQVIKKNWKPEYVTLLKRVVSYRETARIFVHPAVKRALCDAAGEDRAWLRKVRPWWSHNYHFHLRLKCPAGVAGCVNQKPPPAGDGCGPQLTDWMKKLAAAEKWSKTKKKDPAKKAPKRRELRMADLPPACRSVLDADAGSLPRRTQSGPIPKRAAVPPLVRPAAAKTTTDPNLPWLRGIAAPAPKRPAQIPPPERKPR